MGPAGRHIVRVHPGWDVLHGREPVVESWRNILTNPMQTRIVVGGAIVTLLGDVAVVICRELVGGFGDQRLRAERRRLEATAPSVGAGGGGLALRSSSPHAIHIASHWPWRLEHVATGDNCAPRDCPKD